jgi:hypothetical protein
MYWYTLLGEYIWIRIQSVLVRSDPDLVQNRFDPQHCSFTSVNSGVERDSKLAANRNNAVPNCA